MGERETEAHGMDGGSAAGAAAGLEAEATGPLAGGRPGEGLLYVVGTPIGNLGDLSPRAVEAFGRADAVCCEDTRVTGRLLAHAGLSRPLLRCDENVMAQRAPQLVDRLLAGEVLAFASDAGMPGVSDPGQVLVDAALEAGVRVEVVPGPVACVTALVASGIPCEHFFFEGFLPRKSGERVRRLQQLAGVPGALLFYESPHRTADALESIAQVFPGRTAALCRELTKLHEEVLRAPAPELAELVRARGDLRGEVVLVVAPPGVDEPAARGAQSDAAAGADEVEERLRADILAALSEGEGAGAIAKRLSQQYSLRKRAVYDLVLELQE